MSYCWTGKCKMYICTICGDLNYSIIALRTGNVEVQYCHECWTARTTQEAWRIENEAIAMIN